QGQAQVDASRFMSPPSALRLEKGGQSLERKLQASVSAGEAQIWVDDELSGDEARWTISFLFGDKGTIRVAKASGAKLQASSTGVPKLSTLETPLQPGWRRLRLNFSPRSVAVSVDDAALAWSFDQGVAGPLTGIRIELQAARNPAGAVRF